MPDLQPCGTQAAYSRHRKHGEEPCDDCRAANTAYHAEYLKRQASPAVLARKRAYDAAYTRAAGRLIAAHGDEMKTLIAEELDAGS